MSVEDACDELVAQQVVVEEPGRQPDGRIRNPVQRLRMVRHLLGIGQALRKEEGQPIEGTSFVRRETGRRAPGLERLRRSRPESAEGKLTWMPSSSGGASTPICSEDERTPIAALRHIARVSQSLHQHGPGAGHAGVSQPVVVGLPEKP